MKIIVILFILTLKIEASSNSFILEDNFDPTVDKISHATTSFGLYYVFRYFEKSKLESSIFSFTIGLSYEIYQIYDPFEEEYFRGLSLHDIFYNLSGITCALILDSIVKKSNKRFSSFFWKENSSALSFPNLQENQ
tara:strand:+ start:2147 stop:2554 length:408 start_codon:yes stop_codon:yes gene_type:complete